MLCVGEWQYIAKARPYLTLSGSAQHCYSLRDQNPAVLYWWWRWWWLLQRLSWRWCTTTSRSWRTITSPLPSSCFRVVNATSSPTSADSRDWCFAARPSTSYVLTGHTRFIETERHTRAHAYANGEVTINTLIRNCPHPWFDPFHSLSRKVVVSFLSHKLGGPSTLILQLSVAVSPAYFSGDHSRLVPIEVSQRNTFEDYRWKIFTGKMPFQQRLNTEG